MRFCANWGWSFVVLLITGGIASAQPLADRLPDDAILYVGWRGVGDLGPGFEGSHLQALLKESDIPKLVNEFLPQVIEKLAVQGGPDAQEAAALFSDLGRAMWQHPSAIYFGGVDLSDINKPIPKIAFICDAGADSQPLADKLTNLLEKNDDPNAPPMQASVIGGSLVFTIGTFEDSARALLGGPKGVAPAKALGKSAAFTEAMSKVHKDPVAAVYIDAERLMGLISEGIEKGGDRSAKRQWPILRDALGFSGLHRIAWSEGFDGKDWASQLYVAAPAPHVGLLKMFDGKTLADDLFSAIPKSATVCWAARLDLSSILDEARVIASKVEPGSEEEIDKAMKQGSSMMGADIRKDVIDPLGDQWGMYCAPDVGGNNMMGTVFVNRLDDAAAAEKGLAAAEAFANRMMLIGLEREKIKLSIRTEKIEGMTVHYLASPLITPAWTIRNGNLYVALYPQVAVSAAMHGVEANDSILKNPGFAAVTDRLGQKPGAIAFADLPKTAPESYPYILMISRAAGFGDMFGVPSPTMIIPPLNKLLPHLAPAGAIFWSDEKGLYAKSVSPFPGASVLAPQQGALMTTQPLMISILLPSLNRARETANRVKCASNMKQIGQAMLLYSNEQKDGKYPADLGELVTTQDIGVVVFTCPSGGVSVPDDIKKAEPAEQAKWVNENSPYVYMTGYDQGADPDTIILYEKMDDHDQDGTNMLFADGHVEFEMRWNAEEMIEKQNQKTPPPAKPAPMKRNDKGGL